MGKNYKINIKGTEIEISFNKRAQQAMYDLEMSEYVIYGTILAMGEELLGFKNEEQFVIIDEFLKVAIICEADKTNSAIDVITVIEEEHIYIRRGMRILKYGRD